MSKLNELKVIFKNKVVSFSIGADIIAIYVNNIEELAGELFILGNIASSSTVNDWAEGVFCGVAWNKITDFMVFDTQEIYTEAMEKSRDFSNEEQ